MKEKNSRIVKKLLKKNKVGKWVLLLVIFALSDIKTYYKDVGNETV